MNNWGIPKWLEIEVKNRDTHCIYCGIEFSENPEKRGNKYSWEHIVNDAKIITRENIALCCISCNASKGQKELKNWLNSKYCKMKMITTSSIAEIAKAHLAKVG